MFERSHFFCKQKQSEYEVMVSMKVSISFVNFVTVMGGIPVLGRVSVWHIIVKTHHFFVHLYVCLKFFAVNSNKKFVGWFSHLTIICLYWQDLFEIVLTRQPEGKG